MKESNLKIQGIEQEKEQVDIKKEANKIVEIKSEDSFQDLNYIGNSQALMGNDDEFNFKQKIEKKPDCFSHQIKNKYDETQGEFIGLRFKFTEGIQLKLVREYIRQDIKNNYSDCTFIMYPPQEKSFNDSLDLNASDTNIQASQQIDEQEYQIFKKNIKEQYFNQEQLEVQEGNESKFIEILDQSQQYSIYSQELKEEIKNYEKQEEIKNYEKQEKEEKEEKKKIENESTIDSYLQVNENDYSSNERYISDRQFNQNIFHKIYL
ncbi:hypothetical protein PPERSA_04674 [Pseudocohnilembus persalinus]|uniref:Uncharacterized protein n=1 Tax=Pseudocohnilembus persalinus TaxID=266149 RepID=A0A0V0R576_PSEPJ|nr:hypothetical protein PPERSA_04674 [Pseudocohnilembus persalinus]|eukprot:KRX09368.1 hypothetical protein PPERSA_04674 [Pseudocohnilembus persalinus]